MNNRQAGVTRIPVSCESIQYPDYLYTEPAPPLPAF